MLQGRYMKSFSIAFHYALLLIMVITTSAIASPFQESESPDQKTAKQTNGKSAKPAVKQKPIRRAKRPIFKERDWDGIYFNDLFKDGLVGPRPAKLAPGQMPQTPNQIVGGPTGSQPNSSGANVGFAWSKVVSASTLEDEVKSLQQKLMVDVTTPSKFKSDYAKVHQSFSMLSMLFAVVREYDADVRWKKFAPEAQASFEKAAANSRVGTIQAYESCKRRSADLQEMVRGGNFAGTDKAPESLDWSMVVGHSPVMVRLEECFGELKQMTSSENDFNKNLSDVLRRAELVAIMSHAIQQENMEYAEEESYVEFAKQMLSSANKISQGCRTNDFQSVSDGVNAIGQSCSNCHDEWR